MSDVREVLDEIQRYVDAGKLDPVYEAARRAKLRTWQDISGDLVAALRAVLDEADKIDHPDHRINEEGTDVCRECGRYVYGRHPWPCVYRKHAESIRSAITEALGGGA